MVDQPHNLDHDQPCETTGPLHTRFLRMGKGRVAEERFVLRALEAAEMVETQLVPWGSNYTFAASLICDEPEPFMAIYKPEQGEAPLWDFPSGTLYEREYASYLLSRFLGWRFVPPTVIRTGPYGIGTVQLYIEPEQDRRRVSDWSGYRDQLVEMAIFDLITNNADRKASHFFLGRFQRQIWGIDHGLTFNIQPKLRTVIWEFAGEPIEEQYVRRLSRLERHQQALFALLEPYLSHDEILMLMVRAEQIRNSGVMPTLRSRRNIPFGW